MISTKRVYWCNCGAFVSLNLSAVNTHQKVAGYSNDCFVVHSMTILDYDDTRSAKKNLEARMEAQQSIAK